MAMFLGHLSICKKKFLNIWEFYKAPWISVCVRVGVNVGMTVSFSVSVGVSVNASVTVGVVFSSHCK